MIGLSLEEQIQKLKAEEERSILAWNSKPGSFQSTLLKQEQDRWARTPPEALRYEIGEELKVQEALAMVATISGGWTMFLEQPSQADEIYSRIFSDITRRYVLGYYQTNKAHDGKRRKLSIEVRGHPEYLVMGRKSYLAPDVEH